MFLQAGLGAGPGSGDQDVVLVQRVRQCIRLMLDDVSGLKVLYLDNDTSGILSVICGQLDILSKDVFLVEMTSAGVQSTVQEGNALMYMKAVYFIRPSSENILRLISELKSPRYCEYYINFTAPLEKQQLERLARADTKERVRGVRQSFTDIQVLTPTLFSLDVPYVALLANQQYSLWNAYQNALFQRIVDGILSSIVCSTRNFFRGTLYARHSSFCELLAKTLHSNLLKADLLQDLGKDVNADQEGLPGSMLLVVDRRDDPVTPLLNQWRYQAMVHELLGIHRNRVLPKKTNTLESVAGDSDAPDNPSSLPTVPSEVVLSCHADPFFAKHWKSNFGELGVAINAYLEAYQESSKTLGPVDSVSDLKTFVSRYPELRKLSGNVSKHVDILHTLSQLVEANGLLDISRVEQDLACTSRQADHLRAVLERLETASVKPFEKLRLALLYALRYRQDASLATVRETLRAVKMDPKHIKLVDALLAYTASGSKSYYHNHDKNGSFFDFARNVVQRGFKNVPNVYTQHRSQVATLVETALKSNSWESSGYSFLPFCSEHNENRSAPAPNGTTAVPPVQVQPREGKKVCDLVVFCAGGITFQEAADLDFVAQQYGCHIVVGGTTIHNTKSFLADVAHLVPQPPCEISEHVVLNRDHDAAPCVDGIAYHQPSSTRSATLSRIIGYATLPHADPDDEISRDADLQFKKQFLRQKW